MTDEQKTDIGIKWAQILGLKQSSDHKDRYITAWGDKTPLGIYKTITRLVSEVGEY